MKAIPFIEKLPFGLYLLCSKLVKPGHYSVLPSHILRVLLTKYGKMMQQWNNKKYSVPLCLRTSFTTSVLGLGLGLV